MLKTLNALLAIQTSSTANVFIYYLRKLPWIGALLPDHLYAHTRIKSWLAILARILLVLWGFGTRLAYVGLLLYFPVTAFGGDLPKEEQLQLFAHLFFMISFIVAGTSSATILEPKRSKYVAVKLMRMSPVRYMQTTLVYKYVTFLIYLLPAMLLFGTMLGASVLQLVVLSLSATLWRVWCEYLHLKLFERKDVILIKQTALVWIVIALGYAAAYLPVRFEAIPTAGSILLLWPVHLVSVAVGLFAAVRLARYPDYRSVVDAATQRDDPYLDFGRMMKEANQSTVKSKESDYSLEMNQDKLNAKEGYSYLNALFFARHRSLVRRPVHMRLSVIGVLGMLGMGLVLTVEPSAHFLQNHLGTMIPYLVLAMIYFSVGENMCKAIFHHCDLSMLRYSFYRKASFHHFRIRLYRLAGYNLLIAVTLSLALTVVYAVAGGDVWHQDVLLLWASALSLSVFFSIHHLFMYYILQPYTTELNVKNPLYYIIYYIISAAGGICLFIRVPAFLFTAIVLAVTSLYLLAAFVLVRQYGVRTFRVR